MIRAVLAAVAVLALAACGPDYDREATIDNHFHPITVELPDGGSVLCVVAGNSNSFDCDWAGAKR